MRPAARRKVACHLQVVYGISERRACLATGLGRSSQRYRTALGPAGLAVHAAEGVGAVQVRYGYRRLYILLRREGWKVNHKRTYRIYRDEDCRSGPSCPSASGPGTTARGDRRLAATTRSGRWTSYPTASSTGVRSGS